jgi:hypothetical protein
MDNKYNMDNKYKDNKYNNNKYNNNKYNWNGLDKSNRKYMW